MIAIISFLGSGAFGSIIGALFAWLNRREERAVQAEKYKHEQAMVGLQNQQNLLLADKAKEQVREAGQQAVAKAEVDAFAKSQETFRPKTAFMEVVNGVIRPLITIYLLVAGTYIAFEVNTLVGGLKSFDPATLFTLYGSVIDQVFFLLNLTVSWWFGARGSSPRSLFKK
jgi:hypothetical protein